MKNIRHPISTREQLAAARRELRAEAQRRGMSLPDVLRERIPTTRLSAPVGRQRGEEVTHR